MTHSLAQTLKRLVLLYVATYAFAFTMEGWVRLRHGVGSVTAIERATPNRGEQAKALVARQKRIDEMNDDWLYRAYICVVFFGTPIALVVLLIHDIRFVNNFLRRVWFPVRWFVIGFVLISGGGLLVLLGPFIAAERFYDRTSPAELLRIEQPAPKPQGRPTRPPVRSTSRVQRDGTKPYAANSVAPAGAPTFGR